MTTMLVPNSGAMKLFSRSVVFILLVCLPISCSAEKEEQEGILPQGYTDALDKADSVEGMLKDSEKKRREETD